MARTSILYPLLTLKTRVQSEINTRRKMGSRPPPRLGTRWKLTLATAQKNWNAGNLYAGLIPALVVTVPATGLYYGTREVVKRMLMSKFPNIPVLLAAAFAGDVIALAFRTPADTLSIRLQAEVATQTTNVESAQKEDESYNATHFFFADMDMDGVDLDDEVKNEQENLEAFVGPLPDVPMFEKKVVGNWFLDSIERLPAVIITDLPYLLSRIILNRSILQLQGSSVGVGRYELTVVFTALLCAFLTTPFDVARTRILIDSTCVDQDNVDDNEESLVKGIDGGSGEGLLRTFQTIYNEGDGGIRNLFAGWLERTAYLGIGRACLEPLQLIGYMAIRDYILLEWFD